MYIDTQQQTTTSNQASGASTMIMGFERPYYTVLVGVGSPRDVARTCKVLDLHVNSIAVYVCPLPMCRSAQNAGCAAQTNPTPDLTLTPTLNPTLREARGVLSRSAGAVSILSLRANLKTLRVRTCDIASTNTAACTMSIDP